MQQYRIFVEGTLEPSWSDCLGGLAISVLKQPAQPVITELRGPLPDQAALQGVLDTLFMLNLSLVSVERYAVDN